MISLLPKETFFAACISSSFWVRMVGNGLWIKNKPKVYSTIWIIQQSLLWTKCHSEQCYMFLNVFGHIRFSPEWMKQITNAHIYQPRVSVLHPQIMDNVSKGKTYRCNKSKCSQWAVSLKIPLCGTQENVCYFIYMQRFWADVGLTSEWIFGSGFISGCIWFIGFAFSNNGGCLLNYIWENKQAYLNLNLIWIFSIRFRNGQTYASNRIMLVGVAFVFTRL